MMRKILKVSFLAPTGYGKTTAAEIIEKNFKAKNIKLADPLYDMQRFIYERLHKKVHGQDGELLQFLGSKIQREYPGFLADEFLEKEQMALTEGKVNIIVNDDCRPHNYPFLKKDGFLFIGIAGKRYLRDDVIPLNSENEIEWQQEIPADYMVCNMGDKTEYEKNVICLIEQLLKEKLL